MKFASLLALVSLIASVMAVNVTSADGTNIWAESTGDPSKPAVVFIPGFSCTSLAFDKQWTDPTMKANLFMVRKSQPRLPWLLGLLSWDPVPSSIVRLNLSSV
jgi:pimeloyl-ACP methyl ester carboxylesterase